MKTYHGLPPHGPVVVREDAVLVATLANTGRGYRHSPTGFSWGYGGSGPAALAYAILRDVLGDDALCRTCGGSSEVAGHRPCGGAGCDGCRSTGVVAARSLEALEDSEGRCFDCEDGVRLPVSYQEFKFDVVARWPSDEEWRIGEDEVRAWIASHAAAEETVR